MILVMGIPGAGKTTYSAQYDEVIHADEYGSKRKDELYEAVKKAGEDVCVEGLFLKRDDRIALLKACRKKEHKKCAFLDTPVDICVKREGRHTFLAPLLSRKLEPPTEDEGWNEIEVLK